MRENPASSSMLLLSVVVDLTCVTDASFGYCANDSGEPPRFSIPK